MRWAGCSLIVLALAAGAADPVAAQDGEVVVLTALPATYSIASALAEGTSIVVRNVPERPRPMGALGNFLDTRADDFADDFRAAQAVVTIGRVWTDDPLFESVRAVNIRVVDIDASTPWSRTLEGVSVLQVPRSTVPWAEPGEPRRPSVHFWLSLSNGIRAAEIVAADFARLSPPDAERVRRNLADYRRRLLALKLEYEAAFAEAAGVALFALAPEFAYLTADMGLFVEGYFVKDDIDWTEEDIRRLSSYLKDSSIGVVVHKWDPSPPIQAAIEGAGARLAILDPVDLGIVEGGRLRADSYLEVMRANLEALHEALRQVR